MNRMMSEKELTAFNVVEAVNRQDARYVTEIYGKNIEALHGNEIMFDEWNNLLSSGDTDEKHFLILKGAIPCAYLKVNGLESGDTIGWISMLAVEPAFHRNGVGEYAVSYAEEYACTLRVPLGDEGEYSRKVLGYPEEYFMPCFIGIGRPQKNITAIKQKDIDLKQRIHWDRW